MARCEERRTLKAASWPELCPGAQLSMKRPSLGSAAGRNEGTLATRIALMEVIEAPLRSAQPVRLMQSARKRDAKRFALMDECRIVWPSSTGSSVLVTYTSL